MLILMPIAALTLLVLAASAQLNNSKKEMNARDRSSAARVIDGLIAKRGQFKFAAYLSCTGPELETHCSGSLIAWDWVLTAAHCVSEHTNCEVFLNRVDLTKIDSQTIRVPHTRLFPHKCYPHPSDHTRTRYDVALVKFPEPLQNRADLELITLVSAGRVGENFDGKVMTTVGYGDWKTETTSTHLRYADVQAWSTNKCQQGNNLAGYYFGIFQDKYLMCARDPGSTRGICIGDSGGPMFYRQGGATVQVAINAFVSHITVPCDPAYPQGFVRVAEHVSWITKIINSGGTGGIQEQCSYHNFNFKPTPSTKPNAVTPKRKSLPRASTSGTETFGLGQQQNHQINNYNTESNKNKKKNEGDDNNKKKNEGENNNNNNNNSISNNNEEEKKDNYKYYNSNIKYRGKHNQWKHQKKPNLGATMTIGFSTKLWCLICILPKLV